MTYQLFCDDFAVAQTRLDKTDKTCFLLGLDKCRFEHEFAPLPSSILAYCVFETSGTNPRLSWGSMAFLDILDT